MVEAPPSDSCAFNDCDLVNELGGSDYCRVNGNGDQTINFGHAQTFAHFGCSGDDAQIQTTAIMDIMGGIDGTSFAHNQPIMTTDPGTGEGAVYSLEGGRFQWVHLDRDEAQGCLGWLQGTLKISGNNFEHCPRCNNEHVQVHRCKTYGKSGLKRLGNICHGSANHEDLVNPFVPTTCVKKSDLVQAQTSKWGTYRNFKGIGWEGVSALEGVKRMRYMTETSDIHEIIECDYLNGYIMKLSDEVNGERMTYCGKQDHSIWENSIGGLSSMAGLRRLLGNEQKSD